MLRIVLFSSLLSHFFHLPFLILLLAIHIASLYSYTSPLHMLRYIQNLLISPLEMSIHMLKNWVYVFVQCVPTDASWICMENHLNFSAYPCIGRSRFLEFRLLITLMFLVSIVFAIFLGYLGHLIAFRITFRH